MSDFQIKGPYNPEGPKPKKQAPVLNLDNDLLKDVKNIICIASGKGGRPIKGKSGSATPCFPMALYYQLLTKTRPVKPLPEKHRRNRPEIRLSRLL